MELTDIIKWVRGANTRAAKLVSAIICVAALVLLFFDYSFPNSLPENWKVASLVILAWQTIGALLFSISEIYKASKAELVCNYCHKKGTLTPESYKCSECGKKQ